MFTKQETFDTVVNFLKAQGCQAFDEMTCCYRTSTGLKCAAGCLISDADYDPFFEGLVVDEREKDKKDSMHNTLLAALADHDRKLVSQLQCAHDVCVVLDFVPDFLKKAKRIAADHDLDTACCEMEAVA